MAGPDVAVIDSATATASALAGLLEVNGLAAPATDEPSHVQLTTGDVAAFERTAETPLRRPRAVRSSRIVLAGAA